MRQRERARVGAIVKRGYKDIERDCMRFRGREGEILGELERYCVIFKERIERETGERNETSHIFLFSFFLFIHYQ